MTRKEKEAALRSYLTGNLEPLRQLSETGKSGIYILADRPSFDGYTQVTVQRKDGILESYPSLDQSAFTRLIKRLEKSHHLLIIY